MALSRMSESSRPRRRRRRSGCGRTTRPRGPCPTSNLLDDVVAAVATGRRPDAADSTPVSSRWPRISTVSVNATGSPLDHGAVVRASVVVAGRAGSSRSTSVTNPADEGEHRQRQPESGRVCARTARPAAGTRAEQDARQASRPVRSPRGSGGGSGGWYRRSSGSSGADQSRGRSPARDHVGLSLARRRGGSDDVVRTLRRRRGRRPATGRRRASQGVPGRPGARSCPVGRVCRVGRWARAGGRVVGDGVVPAGDDRRRRRRRGPRPAAAVGGHWVASSSRRAVARCRSSRHAPATRATNSRWSARSARRRCRASPRGSCLEQDLGDVLAGDPGQHQRPSSTAGTTWSCGERSSSSGWVTSGRSRMTVAPGLDDRECSAFSGVRS